MKVKVGQGGRLGELQAGITAEKKAGMCGTAALGGERRAQARAPVPPMLALPPAFDNLPFTPET